MALSPVIEITTQLDAVMLNTFIDRWAAVVSAGKDRHATGLSAEHRERSARGIVQPKAA
jgi:hypothetical protein